MIQKCIFFLFEGEDTETGYEEYQFRDFLHGAFKGWKKGYFDPLRRFGKFKSALLKVECVGLPEETVVYQTEKNVPLIFVNLTTHLAINLGKSMPVDAELSDLLKFTCEDKVWRYMGSVDISVWQMLALIGAGVGILGAIQLIIQALK